MTTPEKTSGTPDNPDFSILKRIRVVLSHTSHPGNIGSVARAMKTMGLEHLYLVNPKHFPDPQAVSLASGAADILDNATVVSSLEEALAGTTMQAALTARRRELTLPLQSPQEVVPALLHEVANGQQVAIVFGTEMSGLTIEEVRLCNRLVTIPCNPDYSSLNLAQAVQVLCYELRREVGCNLELWRESDFELATHEDSERLFTHMESTLIQIGFLNPDIPKRLMPRLRRLFGRTQLERVEVDILRGILRTMDEKG